MYQPPSACCDFIYFEVLLALIRHKVMKSEAESDFIDSHSV